MIRLHAALWPALLLLAQDGEPDRHRKGAYVPQFTDHHPLSAVAEVCKRVGWKPADVRKADPAVDTWKLQEESYEVVVPDSYSPDKAAGLLVWISPMDSGRVPEEWPAVLAKRHLIVIGANNSGNDRGPYYRMALALDAVHNMQKRYNLDPKRIYITGFSGGGRASSRIGILYPDVFRGGLYQGGIEFYKDVTDPADPKKSFRAGFNKPEGDLFKKVRQESRHVVLAGSEDFNHRPSKAIFEMMKKEQFANAAFLEMPGEDHVPATVEWLEKALDFLDAPPKDAKPKK